MAKMTLLEIVQSIASDMDSDYVNDIGESVESEQLTNIVKQSYFYIINNVLELPEHQEILTLTALGDTNHPTWFLIPDNVKRIDLVRYNTATLDEPDLRYEDIEWMEPLSFQWRVNQRTESDDNVVAYSDFNAGKLLIQNDKKPQWWTTFDDKYVIMDSYDSSVESTLQSSKLFCYGLKEPAWELSNSFVPDLDAEFFPLLLNEAKAQAFIDIKQVSNTKAEQRARKQATSIHNKMHKHLENYHAKQPNYGRK